MHRGFLASMMIVVEKVNPLQLKREEGAACTPEWLRWRVLRQDHEGELVEVFAKSSDAFYAVDRRRPFTYANRRAQ
jgi:hypothetical protein